MSVVKVNKDQLSIATTDIKSKVTNINSTITDLRSILKSIPSHSEFEALTSKASMIADSINGIYTDLECVSTNLNNYVNGIMEIDSENIDTTNSEALANSTNVNVTDNVTQTTTNSKTKWSTAENTALTTLASNYGSAFSKYSNTSTGSGNYTYSYSTGPSGTVVYTNNFSSNLLTNADYNVPAGGKYNYEAIELSLKDVDGVTVNLPAGLGSVHTYMGWQCITAVSSRQYKLREAAGMNFDEEGFAKIGDRYVVATTTTFGNVGDYIDVYQEDGTVIKCIIGDIKNQGDAGCTKWGHNNGQCVVEFVVDKKSWYGSPMHSNPGTPSCHPEWNRNITKIVNKGNYFDLIKTEAAKVVDVSTSEENTNNSDDTTLITV